MRIRRSIIGACIIIAAATTPTLARADFDLTIAPPPSQVEVAPEARPGYVWSPGYWNWQDNQHVWTEGRWVAERPGYDWVPEHWEHRGDHWHFRHGHWHHRRQ